MPTTHDDYILTFPAEKQKLLQEMRGILQEVLPEAVEVISYNMPAFKLSKVVVWYAGCANHIGFYPTPGAIQEFKNELKGYKTSKGAVQFPLDRPLPRDLIVAMTKFREKEVISESGEKK